MRYAFHRLCTFNNFSSANAPSLIRLASNGWYSTGKGSETRCFSCGVFYTEWRRDNEPADIHRTISPNCLMVLGKDVNNIPLDSMEKADTGDKNKSVSNQIRNNASSSADLHSEQIGDGAYDGKHMEQNSNANSNGNNIKTRQEKSDSSNPFSYNMVNGNLTDSRLTVFGAGNNRSGDESVSTISVDQLSVSNDFNHVEVASASRMPTRYAAVYNSDEKYRSDRRPHTELNILTTSDKTKVSANRSHYNQQQLVNNSQSIARTETKGCANDNMSTQQTNRNTASGNKDFTLLNATCTRNSDAVLVQNVGSSADAKGHIINVDSAQKWNESVDNLNPKEVSACVLPPLQKEDPRYPQYVVLAVRISSFRGWPSYLKQTERDLAVAGFFFKGYSDEVTCYQCGVTLANWQDEDDACVEHARWRPHCYYIRTYKGDEFVKLVQAAVQQLQRQSPNSRQGETTQTNISKENHQRKSKPGNAKSKIIDKLIEMKFSSEDIQKAIDILESRENGGQHITVDEMIEILFTNPSDSLTASGAALSRTSTSSSSSGLASSRTSTSSSSSFTSQSDFTASSLSRDGPMTASIIPENRPTVSTFTNTLKPFATGKKNDVRNRLEHNDRENGEAENRKKVECKICLDNEVGMIFVPCGHICACVKCSEKLHKCPVCRTHIKKKIRGYLS